MFRFILQQVKDREAAQDIVQDSFEKMWKKLENIDGSKAKTYLFTTAYHTMIDYLRRESRKTSLETVNEDEHAHSTQYTDLRELLHKGLDLLPESQRAVLLLRDYEGYDYAEIGRITGLNESQVKVYIFRARTFLKNYIGRMEVVI